jgi:hypothetical protein
VSGDRVLHRIPKRDGEEPRATPGEHRGSFIPAPSHPFPERRRRGPPAAPGYPIAAAWPDEPDAAVMALRNAIAEAPA